MDAKEIGLIVKKYRKLSNLTQKELAEISGIGKTAVFDIEKGKQSVQLNTLLQVFDILNIKIELIVPFKPEEDH